MPRTITSATTLDALKLEARRWPKALRAGDDAARARLRQAYPSAPAAPVLRQVQQALAREFGLASWARLKVAIAAAAAPPVGPRADALRTLLSAADAGDTGALVRVLDARPDLLNADAGRPEEAANTPLAYAIAEGRTAIADLLRARGA